MNPMVLCDRILKLRIPRPIELVPRRIRGERRRRRRIPAPDNRAMRLHQIAGKREYKRRNMVGARLTAQASQIGNGNLQLARRCDIDIAVGAAELLNEPRFAPAGLDLLLAERRGFHNDKIGRR